MATAARWIGAGERRQLVDIQIRSTGAGGAVIWSTAATRSAHVEMLTQKEQLDAMQLLEGRAGRITFAYDSATKAIRPQDRLKMGARIFEIQAAIDVQELHRQIEVTVTESVN